MRTGRAGYAHLLCFSVGYRHPVGATPWADVLPDRGYTSYAGAAGEAACSEAVRFCIAADRLRAAAPSTSSRPDERAGAARKAPSGDATASRREEAADSREQSETEGAAPPLVLDPFCGEGTILAIANAWGVDSLGLDTNRKRCKVAAARLPKPRTA